MPPTNGIIKPESTTRAKPSLKKVHPILQLPERFQNLSIQFGKEPELNGIQSINPSNGGIISAQQATTPAHSDLQIANFDLTPKDSHSAQPQPPTPTPINGQTAAEPPFRLYDLVKLDPALFWELYHARAYDDLLIRLTYERFLPEDKKGKTNYIETIHLTGTSHEPARTNALEFWHTVEDGADDGVLDLDPDPTNPHDPHAVRVLAASTKKQIGWIPAKENINKLVTRNYQLCCFNSAQLIKVETGGTNGNKNGSKNGSVGIQIAIGWTFPPEILQKYGKTPG